MTTNILGVSAFYHDSAACLVRDGEIIAAAQEERFTRKKHDPAFPIHAVRYCLGEGRIDLRDLRYVAFYDKPLVKLERLLETYLSFAPSGIRSFVTAMVGEYSSRPSPVDTPRARVDTLGACRARPPDGAHASRVPGPPRVTASGSDPGARARRGRPRCERSAPRG